MQGSREQRRPRRPSEVGGRPAVFLDRDGVLNRAEVRDGKPYAPRQLEDFRLLPGVPAAVRALTETGFLVVVVTNQPDIANGLIDAVTVAAMHARLLARLSVAAIEMCPHSQSAGCSCRKPKPGLLLRAASELDIALSRSVMIGDRMGDMEAGKAAGCRTIFIDRRYHETGRIDADAVVRSLPAAAKLIIAGKLGIPNTIKGSESA